MKEILVQLSSAFMGAFGFAVLIGLQKKHLLFAGISGLLTWTVYLIVDHFFPGLFLPNLCASVFAVTFSEFLAHWRKCPSTLFQVPAIIPLVPGSSLYYAMDRTVHSNLAEASTYGRRTLVCAVAIAAGISFVTVCRELRTKKRKPE